MDNNIEKLRQCVWFAEEELRRAKEELQYAIDSKIPADEDEKRTRAIIMWRAYCNSWQIVATFAQERDAFDCVQMFCETSVLSSPEDLIIVCEPDIY